MKKQFYERETNNLIKIINLSSPFSISLIR